MKKRLAIIGASALGQQIHHHAHASGEYEVAGYFDDCCTAGERVNGVPVIGGLSQIEKSYQQGKFDELMVGVGYKHMEARRMIYDKYRGAIPFARIISKSAIIDPTAIIHEGVIIYPGTIVDLRAEIGANVLLNIGVVVSHDSQVGAHSFCAPNVSIAGFVNVGECCTLGINSTIIDNVSLVSEVAIGAGAVVTKSVEYCGVYVGVPAVKISSKNK